jgi:hypothetical protein
MQWFLNRRTPRGLVLAREWEVWDNPLRYQVCEGAGLNAMVYRALIDAAWLGARIGATSAGPFASDAARLQADFNALLWNSQEGSYYAGLFGPGSKTAEQLNGKMFTGPFVHGHYRPTAQAALFALFAGIVPADRLLPVRNWILAHLDQVKGPMSHYYLFHALYRMEEINYDSQVLDRMRSGWKAQVDSPWQTTWEDLIDGGGSKVHMYGVTPGSFLTTHVLGVRRIGSVSDRVILIEPRCADLTWAKGTAITEFGPVKMSWSKSTGGATSIECSTPAETRTTLRLYKRAGQEIITVDDQEIKAATKGAFIEIALPPGKLSVLYS